jgi:epoxyqueuosine reductase
MLDKDFTIQFIEKAKSLGFQDIGISKARELTEEAKNLEKWLLNGFHGDMEYMHRDFDLRIDPKKLFPGAKTIISLTHNYYNDIQFEDASRPKIAKYAYGKDYHKVLKKKCNLLIDWIIEQKGTIQARAFVDSAPILERKWAEISGIGWIGKNSLLLTKGKGSFFFLSEIIIDIPMEYTESKATDYCGKCTKCIDACPTEAIVAPYQIDSNKCISYLTIEYKKELPDTYNDKMNSWIFGCDICQDVCPINARSKNHQEPKFSPNEQFISLNKEEMYNINEIQFNTIFEGSAIKRTKFEGLKRNLDFIKKNED